MFRYNILEFSLHWLIVNCSGIKKSGRVKQKPVKTVESVTTEKEHVNIVFIGHVDAGKSTIGGE